MSAGRIPSVQNASTLAGTTLATNVTGSSLTSFGSSPALTTPTISTATTNGDILYGTGSGAIARLGIGSSAQVLTVASGIPSWATASASAMTLVKAETTFTTVANTSTTFDGVFSSAYNNYLIVFSYLYSSVDGVDLNYQMRYAGPTTSTDAGINGYVLSRRFNGSDVSWGISSATGTLITKPMGNNNRYTTVVMNVNGLDSGTASRYQLNWSFAGGDNSMAVGGAEAGTGVTSRAWTGFILTPASGTISGRATVYGLAKA